VIAAHVGLQQRLQYQFANPDLLQRALTHRSFSADHNERLEFLGDSVLNLVVSDLLMAGLADAAEGDLSRIRANLVRQETLHQLALDLGLAEALRLGEGEVRSGGKKRPSILADALEAIVGAVYQDGGFAAATALVRRLFSDVVIKPGMEATGKDAKTELQEWLQGRKLPLPSYKVIAVTGVAHRQTFDVECSIEHQGLTARGIGVSRRAGEQAAATAVLADLKTRVKP
jgi:ribonuclease III